MALRLKTTCTEPAYRPLVEGAVKVPNVELDWDLKPVPMLSRTISRRTTSSSPRCRCRRRSCASTGAKHWDAGGGTGGRSQPISPGALLDRDHGQQRVGHQRP